MKYAPVSAVAKKSPFGLGKGQQRVVRRVQGEEGTEMVAGEGPVRGRAVPHGREGAGQSLGRRRRAGGQRFLAEAPGSFFIPQLFIEHPLSC